MNLVLDSPDASRSSLHALLLALAAAAAALLWTAAAPGETSVFTSDGAWSWFTTPHVWCSGDTIRAGWVTRTGDIQAGEYCLRTGAASVYDVCPSFEPDDHDCPSLIRTSDGRCTSFYSHHALAAECPLYRVSEECGTIAEWGPQLSTCVNVAGGAGTTYTNPHLVPGATDSIFLFFRGGDWKPCFTTGAYDPQQADWTWTSPRALIYATVGRPYVRYRSSADGRIALAFTDGHPRDIRNNIHFAQIAAEGDGGHAFFRADGTRIRAVGSLPLYLPEADTVFDHAANPAATGDNSWIWDVAFDGEGRPVVAFASFMNDEWHQYHWAVYMGGRWNDHTIVEDAGGSIANLAIGTPECHYSGGIALDPVDPNIVYVSRENKHGGWDIEQMRTHDHGATWTVVPITSGSWVKNVRPVVPERRPWDTQVVLWMSGKYDYFANAGSRVWWPAGSDEYNYNTAVLVWTGHDVATELVQLSTSVPEDMDTRGSVVLHQNCPNPFNPSTEIRFDLPSAAPVELSVLDISGRVVRRLVGGGVMGGSHVVAWDGRDSSGAPAVSGVYFARLTVNGITRTRSMVLLK